MPAGRSRRLQYQPRCPVPPAGDIATLPPLAYTLGSAAAALRQLAAARHVGKVVAADSSGSGSRESSGRWAISGGTGALGALAAQWLVGSGAKHVTLLGRTGLGEGATSAQAPGSAQPASVLEAATSAGSWAAAVTLLKCDAAAAADAAGVLDTTAGGPRQRLPLAGLLNAGGVLRDATLPNQTLPGLRAVLAPKASGTANLAASPAAVLQPLSAVQLFSSVAAALGSGGQANYAAANALLDTAAAGMQQRGLPGMAVNWGAWAGAGMAAHAGEDEKRACPVAACAVPVCLLESRLAPDPPPPGPLPLQGLSAWSARASAPSAPQPAWQPWQPCCAPVAAPQLRQQGARCRRRSSPLSSSGTG